MRDTSRPAPSPVACLVPASLSSTQKGGTLYAEDVIDAATHSRRLSDPDGYRPERCRGCGHDRLHVHDYRERQRRAEGLCPLRVVRYRCVRCEATFLILPLFVARHLWHGWPVVAACTVAAPTTSTPTPTPTPPPVPARTRRRWLARLMCAALLLVRVLATTGMEPLELLAQRVGLHATRAELCRAWLEWTGVPISRCLSTLAALIHRLCPRVRLI